MQNLKLLAQKSSVFGNHLFEKEMKNVNINYHAKSVASNLKIDWVMINFVFWWPFCFLAKICRRASMKYHAKSGAYYLKIDWVMLSLVFMAILFFGKKMRRVIMNYHPKSGAYSLKIDWVMFNFVFCNHFVFWRPFCFL